MMPVVGASSRRASAGSPRAGIYLRVSTEGQVDGTSIDTQRDQCRDLVRRHGFALAGEYVDARVSGAASSRPALDELVAAASAGEIDVILVAKLGVDAVAIQCAWCAEPVISSVCVGPSTQTTT
jgi:hypothetical protein